MKSNMLLIKILVVLILTLLITSCKENEPKGDEFSWSPDGKKLAIINVESNELLLVELESNQIKQVTPIDSISGDKAKIYMPGWSPDGHYLYYTKSSNAALDILTYSVAKNKLTEIDRILTDEKTGVDGRVFVTWSPKMNRIIWQTWNSQAKYQLFSALPDGKDKKQFFAIELVGEKAVSFPAWSPDGEWLAYAVYRQEGHQKNGIWKMKSDGSINQQIFPADEITAFQWAPDGSHLAVVNKALFQTDQKQGKSSEKKYHFRLSLIKPDGNSERLLTEENKQIIKLAWSPDGKQLAFFQKQDNTSDVWIVKLDSNRKVKLNFEDVQDLFGWSSTNQLFYTTDYPDDLVTETKEQKDARELFETLHGVLKENLLVKSTQFQQQNQNTNISAFVSGGKNGAVVYYKSSRPNVSGEAIYYPVIEFADGTRIYPARTKEQFISAADECYLDGRYQNALDHFSSYWHIDLNGTEFSTKFDADTIIKRAKLADDSTSFEKNLEQSGEYFLDNLALLRMVLILRELNEIEKADWMFEQFKKLTRYLNDEWKSENGKSEVIDNLFYAIMGIYSSYNEFASGIGDLDQLLQHDRLDSNLITLTHYAQAILAIQAKQYDLSLQKLESAIKYLPQNLAELDDIKGLLSLCFGNMDGKKTKLLPPILQETIRRFPDNKNIFQIYDMLGDVYLSQGQREKAMEAYRNAVTLNFDQHQIWDKILGIK